MARKVAPSQLTGNTAVINLSEEVPLTCLEFTKLLDNVALSKGVLNVVCGYGSEIREALTNNPHVGIKGNNQFLQHDPLKITDDQRHFAYEDGAPFFWMSDTWWMGLIKRLTWPQEVGLLCEDRVKTALM